MSRWPGKPTSNVSSSRAIAKPPDPAQPAELELKLRLAPEAANALLRHPALATLRRGRARKRHLVSTYFDTPDARLAGARVALRLRRDSGHWIQTLKGGTDPRSGGGLAARSEYEWDRGRSPHMPSPDIELAR